MPVILVGKIHETNDAVSFDEDPPAPTFLAGHQVVSGGIFQPTGLLRDVHLVT